MNTKKNNLRIAIQKKGKLTSDSLTYLSNYNFCFNVKERELWAMDSFSDTELILSRDDDIPALVRNNLVDIGIVGKDVVIESQLDIEIIKELDFGRCRLSFAIPKNSNIKYIKDMQSKKIATSYPNIVKDFLQKNSIKAEVIYLSGGVEIAPKIGAADLIADLVLTGETLIQNDLKEFIKIDDFNAVLISSKQIPIERKEKLFKIFNINQTL